MFSGNIHYRGDKNAVEEVLYEATQVANLATVKKAALGLPNFREQVTLSSGATLDVVLGEHHTFMVIYADPPPLVVEEEVEVVEEEENPVRLFTVTVALPTVADPDTTEAVQFLVSRNGKEDVTVALAKDILAGCRYTQESEELITVSNVLTHDGAPDYELIPGIPSYIDTPSVVYPAQDYMTDGMGAALRLAPQFGTGMEDVDAYIGGFLLTNNRANLGFGVVQGERYCMVYATGNQTVEFYSHAVIDIDYEQVTGNSTPLINYADYTLDYTLSVEDDYATLCYFNDDGTSAEIGQMLGVDIVDAENSRTKRTMYRISLAVNDDEDGLDITVQTDVEYASLDTTQTVVGYDSTTIAGSSTPLSSAIAGCDGATPVHTGSYVTQTVESLTTPDNDAVLTVARGTTGEVYYGVEFSNDVATYMEYTFSDAIETSGISGTITISKNTYVKGPVLGGAKTGASYYPRKYLAADYAVSSGLITGEPPSEISQRVDRVSVANATYTISGNTQFSLDAGYVGYSGYELSGTSPGEMLSSNTSSSSEDTGTCINNLTIQSDEYSTELTGAPAVYTSNAEKDEEEATLVRFSLQAQCAIALHRTIPYNSGSLDNEWPDPISWREDKDANECGQSLSVRLNMGATSVAVPGLPVFDGTLPAGPDRNCAATGPTTISNPGDGTTVNTTTAAVIVTPIEAPFAAELLTHPEGYVFIATTDWYLQKQLYADIWVDEALPRRHDDPPTYTPGTNPDVYRTIQVYIEEAGVFIDILPKINAVVAGSDALAVDGLTVLPTVMPDSRSRYSTGVLDANIVGNRLGVLQEY